FSPIGCTCPREQALLIGIPIEQCVCRDVDDPRAGSMCKVTEDCKIGVLEPSNRGCFCNSNYQQAGCTCTEQYSQIGCICDLLSTTYNATSCLATKPCSGGDFINSTPTGCTPPDCTSSSQTYKCNCKNGLDPVGCVCPSSGQDLTGISNKSCPCLPTGDIRAGTTCPSYCTGPDQPNSDCICDIEPDQSTGYPLLDCQASKENQDQKGISFATLLIVIGSTATVLIIFAIAVSIMIYLICKKIKNEKLIKIKKDKELQLTYHW
ncbi:MAG: hypothetical protein EZS28_051202, partial [Streblomastix strix]